MALSDLTVRQAKTTGKRYTLSDNDCLGLMVSAAGGKSWQFRYYWLGKQKRLCLGGYPALSLREARIERDKAQALLARGSILRSSATRNGTRPSWRANTPSRPSSMPGSSIAARNSRKAVKARCRRSCASSTRTCCPPWEECRSTTFAALTPGRLGGDRETQGVHHRRRSAPGSTSCSAMPWSLPRVGSQPGRRPGRGGRAQAPVAHNPYLHLPEMPEFLQKLRLYNPVAGRPSLASGCCS